MDKLIEIGNYYINKNNIRYIKTDITSSNGYVWKKTYHILIWFDKEHYLDLLTYDYEEHKEWLEKLI